MSKGNWSWIPEEAKEQWGFTVSELAAWLGVKRQVVDNWVRGRNDPDIANVIKLARLVGSIEELARRTGIDIDFSPPGVLQFNPPFQHSKHRDYENLRSIAEWMKYTSRFKELYEQSHELLRDAAGQDKHFTAQLFFNLAYAELMLGRPQDAVRSVTKARKMLPPKKDSLLLADTHWFAGECLRVVSKFSEAQHHLEEARKVYQRVNAKPSFRSSGPLWLEWDFGRIYAAYGQYDKAADYFLLMEKLARENWLAEGEVIASWSYGDIDETKSRFKAALLAYHDAEQLAGEIGDKFWEAMALWRIAEVYRKTSAFKAALQAAEAARNIFREIGNERMVSKVDCTTAACYLMAGLYNEARGLYYNAVENFVQTGDTQMQHLSLLGLGYIRLIEESQKTTPNFKDILPTFVDLDARRPKSYEIYQAVTEDLALAEAFRLAGYTSHALSRYHTVEKTSARYGYQLERAHALMGIAATKSMKGEVDRERCIEALEIYRRLGSRWGEVQALITRTIIEFGTGGNGSEYLQEASRIRQEISLKSDRELFDTLPGIDFDTLKRYVFIFL